MKEKYNKTSVQNHFDKVKDEINLSNTWAHKI